MMARPLKHVNLLLACARGEYELLKFYIERNKQRSNYTIYDNHSWGPLHHAVASNSVECVQLLLDSELVDTRWKSYEGHTCLYVAADRPVNIKIIELLLRADPELFNIPDNESHHPIHKAVMRDSMEVVRTMIGTLKGIGFEIKDQFDWEGENSLILASRRKNLEMVKFILENIDCNVRHVNDSNMDAATMALGPSDDEANAATLELFKFLIPLTCDLTQTGSLQQLMQPLAFASIRNDKKPFDWLIETYFLADSNDHHDLVRRCLDSFKEVSFEYRLILTALHSGVSEYLVRSDDQMRNEILYRNILNHFLDIFKHSSELFEEIGAILSPKLHLESLKYSIMKFIPIVQLDGTEIATNLVKIFEIIRIGDMLKIEQLLFFTPSANFLNNVFLLFMPFSTKASADYYVEACTKNRSGSLLETLGEDEGLARFCVEGNFRKRSSLKALCRREIRSSILAGLTQNECLQTFLFHLRSLGLPGQIYNYLLFNYTSHVFK